MAGGVYLRSQGPDSIGRSTTADMITHRSTQMNPSHQRFPEVDDFLAAAALKSDRGQQASMADRWR
jgi:hypothetical protein